MIPQTFRRSLHSTRRLFAEPQLLGVAPPPRRPAGAFRGSLLGFLLGITAASSYGYFKLFSEYQSASTLLLVSVEELKASTQKLSNHLRRIDNAERELESLKQRSGTREDAESLRTELRKEDDSLRLELLDLKAHLAGVEQDLQALLKKDATQTKV